MTFVSFLVIDANFVYSVCFFSHVEGFKPETSKNIQDVMLSVAKHLKIQIRFYLDSILDSSVVLLCKTPSE